jgi:hypothetical protein
MNSFDDTMRNFSVKRSRPDAAKDVETTVTSNRNISGDTTINHIVININTKKGSRQGP